MAAKKNASKKQRILAGNVHEIQLDQDTKAYAQVVNTVLFAFFDLFVTGETPPKEVIVAAPIAFRMLVYDPFETGHWKLVGRAPVSAAADARFEYWRPTPGRNDVLSKGDLREGLVPVEQCAGLEKGIVWSSGSPRMPKIACASTARNERTSTSASTVEGTNPRSGVSTRSLRFLPGLLEQV